MRLDIMVDVDCVTADLVRAILEIVGQDIDRTNLKLEWDWFEKYNLDNKVRVIASLNDWHFWRDLPLDG